MLAKGEFCSNDHFSAGSMGPSLVSLSSGDILLSQELSVALFPAALMQERSSGDEDVSQAAAHWPQQCFCTVPAPRHNERGTAGPSRPARSKSLSKKGTSSHNPQERGGLNPEQSQGFVPGLEAPSVTAEPTNPSAAARCCPGRAKLDPQGCAASCPACATFPSLLLSAAGC